MTDQELTEYPWERPLGARPLDPERTEFRVWAPRAKQLGLRIGGETHPLQEEGYGIFAATVAAPAGTDYWFVVDGDTIPDPATRWQPEGLRGPSRVFAPHAPAPLSKRVSLEDLVILELHTGTFSRSGTFAGAIDHLDELVELGINAIELMPVAEFPGARGWGYDGVYISAAQSSYGGPEQLLELIGAAHARGIAVILDVVYNHVGVSGVQTLEAFGPYFTEKYGTPWGKAMNFDDEECDPVREWVLQSAQGWVRDFGIDGLRLDAIHAIHDSSPEHIVARVVREVHEVHSDAIVILESGLNDGNVIRPTAVGGWGADAAWADDFHHAVRTLVTDERDGYYAEFGQVAQLAKAFQRPHVHDGGYSSFRKRRFGAPADDVPPERFVVFDQNHDQVGNRAFGDRLPPQARPLAAFLTLLSPFTPMLFMGEEYGEPAPFQFFSDHIDPEVADATRTGRREEFAAFASFGHEVPDPQAVETFENSKLTRERDPELRELYARLIKVRAQLPRGDVDEIAFSEGDRWLRIRRGNFDIIAQFGEAHRSFDLDTGADLVLATDPAVQLTDGRLILGPMSGAVVRNSGLWQAVST